MYRTNIKAEIFSFRNEASNGNKNNFNNLSNESDNQGLKGELKARISKKKKNKNQGKNSEANDDKIPEPVKSLNEKSFLNLEENQSLSFK